MEKGYEQAGNKYKGRLPALIRSESYQSTLIQSTMKHRMNCKHCGRGFLAEPWDKHSLLHTCFKARCEKESGIYSKPNKQANVSTLLSLSEAA